MEAQYDVQTELKCWNALARGARRCLLHPKGAICAGHGCYSCPAGIKLGSGAGALWFAYGTVTDATGAAVPGAQVVALELHTV